MPKFKPVKSLVQITTEVSANLVHKTSVYLDSISWPQNYQTFQEHPRTFRSGHSSPLPPNLSPLNPHHAAVILSPISETTDSQCPESASTSQSESCQHESYQSLCSQLQLWFRQLPVHLLELVISNVIILCTWSRT